MENNEINNESVGLLKKTYAKFKSSKIVQKLAALTIAAATVLTLTGCEDYVVTPPDDVDINENNQNNEQNNENNNENRNPIDVSGYSQILQNILLDEDYDKLLSQIQANNSYQLWETGTFEPHPYAFYESQGFDVQAIKNDKIDAYTMSYVLDEEPNSLYIYTRVMQDNSYWINYLLKYHLTDKEMEDYHFLHTGQGRTKYFIQSVFMNNEISKTRTPEIIGTSKISVKALENMTNSMQFTLFQNVSGLDLIFLNPNKEDLSFDMYLIPRYNKEHQICFEENVIHCDGESYLMDFNGDVFTGPTQYGDWISLNNRKDYGATYYFSQDANMNYINCESLENTNE